MTSIKGSARIYKTTIASPPEIKTFEGLVEVDIPLISYYFVIASLIAGTRDVDRELVTKDGSINSGRANPVNAPYCFVAVTVATPARARACATTIGSKNQEMEPIILLPVVGMAILISS